MTLWPNNAASGNGTMVPVFQGVRLGCALGQLCERSEPKRCPVRTKYHGPGQSETPPWVANRK